MRRHGCRKDAEPELLLEYILQEIAFEKDMDGLKVLVTAGPTREAVDPVRYIHESFHRKDGICHCQNMRETRRGRYACERSVGTETAGVCKRDFCQIRKGYV